MNEHAQLRQIVSDLIDVVHAQAKELERLVQQVEQVAGRVPLGKQFSVIASELSELHVRIQKLSGG